MPAPSGYLSRRGEILVLILVTLGATTLMLLSASRKDLVARAINDTALTPVQAATASARGVLVRRAEADSLRAELARAELDLASLEESGREAVRLRRMLDFREGAGFRLLPARVIAREAERNGPAYKIDRGARDGLREDLAVLTPDGLVGKIVLIEPRAAYIRPLNSRGCRVSTRLTRTRADGVLDWSPERGLHLTFVPLRAEAAIGDPVVTSGLGGVFPRGIRVGHVAAVETAPTDGSLRLLIEPAVNFSALEEVFIVLGGEGPEIASENPELQ